MTNNFLHLPCLGKILLKLVFIQCNDFINVHNVLKKFQTGFRPF